MCIDSIWKLRQLESLLICWQFAQGRNRCEYIRGVEKHQHQRNTIRYNQIKPIISSKSIISKSYIGRINSYAMAKTVGWFQSWWYIRHGQGCSIIGNGRVRRIKISGYYEKLVYLYKCYITSVRVSPRGESIRAGPKMGNIEKYKENRGRCRRRHKKISSWII